MKTIHKYHVPIGVTAPISLPRGTHILNVDIQETGVYFWALIDPELSPHEQETRRFTAIGTGWDVHDNWKYIGTGQSSQEFVWHVFEVE